MSLGRLSIGMNVHVWNIRSLLLWLRLSWNLVRLGLLLLLLMRLIYWTRLLAVGIWGLNLHPWNVSHNGGKKVAEISRISHRTHH